MNIKENILRVHADPELGPDDIIVCYSDGDGEHVVNSTAQRIIEILETKAATWMLMSPELFDAMQADGCFSDVSQHIH